MAPDIVAELGKHSQYFEPFCGSMAVLFAKQKSQKETVNDLHGDLINLARVLQDEKTAIALYERLSRALFSEDLLEQARDYLDDTSSLSLFVHHNLAERRHPEAIDRAYWYFLASWMGRNGTAGTARVDYQIAVRWTKSGGSPTVRWRNAVESIPAWHARLLNVVILCRDAFRIIDRFEDVKETAIYVDSPYVMETRGAAKNGKSGKYLYEFEATRLRKHSGLFPDEDDEDELDPHERLRNALAAYKNARIIVSHYDCLRVRELYEGWTFVDHRRHKHLHAQNGRGATRKDAPEVLIINGPSYAVDPGAAGSSPL